MGSQSAQKQTPSEWLSERDIRQETSEPAPANRDELSRSSTLRHVSAGHPARLTPAALTTPECFSYPLTRAYPRAITTPRTGELQVWRFRCEWLPVPVQEGDTWLSRSERERARMHPNAALRKRFISARVVARWIVAHLFHCAPDEVDLQDDGQEKLRAQHPADGPAIVIDIAYGGIWIVIGIATAALGVSVAVPSPTPSPEATPHIARRRARYDSLCSALRQPPADVDSGVHAQALATDAHACTLDLAGQGAWKVLDLPMAGKIRAAVTMALPLTRVHMIGWPKVLVFDKPDA